MIEIGVKKYRIVFSEQVIRILRLHCERSMSLSESGGILLGQVVQRNLYILKASIPTKKDRASRFMFLRNKNNAQSIIDYEFENSDGRTIYLGEWHTHPVRLPAPSKKDEGMIEQQFNCNELNEQYLVLAICGGGSLYAGIQDHEGLKGLTVKFGDHDSI